MYTGKNDSLIKRLGNLIVSSLPMISDTPSTMEPITTPFYGRVVWFWSLRKSNMKFIRHVSIRQPGQVFCYPPNFFIVCVRHVFFLNSRTIHKKLVTFLLTLSHFNTIHVFKKNDNFFNGITTSLYYCRHA